MGAGMHSGEDIAELGELRFHLRAWIRTRLWAQVLIGLVLGIVVGALLGPDLNLIARDTADTLGAWLALPGKIFLALIAMVLVPLVMVSIIQGITQPKDGGQLKSVGIRLAIIVVITTTIAALIGVVLALWLEPGTYIEGFKVTSEYMVPVTEAAAVMDEVRAPDLIANLIPSNPQLAITSRDMLAIVIIALMVGIACRSIKPERIDTFLHYMNGMLEISLIIIKWAMFLAPYAVFGLMAQLVATVGMSTIVGMSVYVFSVVGGLVALLVIFVAMASLLGKINPITFLKAISEVQLLAFSTSSSAAVMPVSIDTAVKKLGVSESMASLVIPLGATINMAGTALYQAIAILFLAQMSGVDLSVPDMGMIIFTLVVSSIGAPGTPGVSIAILTTVAASFGIPVEGMVLILGVDRLLDMCRTVVNVTGDITSCFVLSKKT